MYYISDYRKKAVTKITPYLIDFNEIVKLIECNSDRYQAIEDLLWKVADNLKVDNSRGVFLQALAHNEATNIIYTDMAQDAFTYGTDEPLYQSYGSGHYYSQASYISGIKKDISDEKLIRAVKAKIIQNNTNCTVEDLIEGLKLYYNADNVYVYESNPLQVSIFLVGKNLEVSSSQNKEIIKAFLPACVKLNEIFVDTRAFEIFKYSNTPSYGNSRYPTVVRETVDLYSYHSKSISLNSEYEEYIKTNHTSFANNMFTTICFSTQESVTEGVILSSYNTDGTDGFEIGIGLNTDSKTVFYLKYKENINYTEVEVESNKNYTLLLLNKNNELKLWCLNGVGLQGNDIEYEKSYINKTLSNTTPNTSVLDFITSEAPIYINCSYYNETLNSLSNLTYHIICFGLYEDGILLTEYYPTCYGEKQILFNCIKNNNHLKINTTKILDKNITVRQGVYNYKAEHSNGIYAYFDGKSGLDYDTGVDDFDKSKFTVVGSPTITNDGVASGFSSSNYIETSTSTNSQNSWSVVGKFKTTNLNTLETLFLNYMGGVTQNRVEVFINYGKLAASVDVNGVYIATTATGSYQIKANTEYYFKLAFTGSSYIFYYSLDGNNWVRIWSVDNSTNVYQTKTRIGNNTSADRAFQGSIDLKYFSITVDGKEIFSGNKSGLQPQGDIDLIDISFETVTPFNFTEGSIISGFVPSESVVSKIYFTQDGKMSFELPIYTLVGDVPTESLKLISTLLPVVDYNEYAMFNVKIQDNTIFIYKNNELLEVLTFEGYLMNLPDLVKIGYHDEVYYNGIIRNLKIFISLVSSEDGTKIELPLTNEVYNEKLTNNGVRFITVPQLMSNKNNIDIYNNNTTR